MNVFGVGPAELIVVLVIALIFVGPERLPKLAADIARTMRELRKYANSFADEFNEVIKEIEEDAKPARAEWKEIGQGLTDAAKPIAEELQAVQTDIESNGTAPAPARQSTGETT